MGVIESLKSVVDTGGGTGSTETFDYRCADCGEEFERPKRQMYSVRCPACQSADVRDAGD